MPVTGSKILSKTFVLMAVSSFITHASSQTIQVSDNESTIPGCRVTCSRIGLYKPVLYVTDANGTANLQSHFTPGDKIDLRIEAIGFLPYSDTVELTETLKVTLTESYDKLDQLVVTGVYAPLVADKAIHKITVINRKQIETQGAVTLKDVLQNQTGIRLNQDGVLGSSMSLQGVSGENIKIMIDGVPVVGRLDGSIDLSQILLSDIERIEIVEGPLSVEYGSNALGGTINLITRKDVDDKLSVQPGFYYESAGQYNADLRIGLRKKKHQFSLNTGRNYFDGWNPGEDVNLIPEKTVADSGRFQSWKPKEQYYSKARYSFTHKKITYSPYISYFTETVLNRGLPRAPYNESAFDDRYRTERCDAGFAISGALSAKWNLNVVGASNFYNRNKNTWYKDLTNLEETLTMNAGDQDTSAFMAFMSRGSVSFKSDSSLLNYQIGYDVNHETAEGRRITDGTQSIGDYALFGSGEVLLWNKSLTVQPGIRLAYNTDYKAPVVPSVRLRYERKNWVIRAAYANGFRAPSVKELYFDFVDINHNITGNADLQAELSQNYQISVQKKVIFRKSVLKFGAGAYRNAISNQITLGVQPNGSYTYLNISEFTSKGFDLSVRLLTDRLSVQSTATYIGRRNFIDSDYGLTEFLYSPEVKCNIMYRLKKVKTDVSIYYKYTGRLATIYLDEYRNPIQGQTQAYNTLDVSMSRKFFKERVGVTAGCKNIFNVTDLNSTIASGGAHSGGTSVLSAWGRTIFISLNLNIARK